MRLDILEYLAQGCPSLSPSSLPHYTPKDPSPVTTPWDLLPRFYNISEDAHVIKTIRSLLIAEKVTKEWQGRSWLRIKNAESWLNAHYVLLDGMAKDGLWVRGAGFPEAWEGKPKL